MDPVGNSRRRFPAETGGKITAVLDRGRELTVNLQGLLRSATATEHDRRALAAEILSCFTEVISVLDYSESAGGEISCPDHSLCSDLDSGNSRRSTAVKNIGRGNKRRRLENSEIVTSATVEDAHAWRKYGQKVILNATHPRCYYRCTHKYGQGCGARKQVQKMEGNSQMFKITYISHHTCALASPIAVVSTAPEPPVTASDSYNISFSDLGDQSSGVTDDLDVWSGLKDFGSLSELTAAMADLHYCFSAGDDGNSSSMFWSSFLE